MPQGPEYLWGLGPSWEVIEGGNYEAVEVDGHKPLSEGS